MMQRYGIDSRFVVCYTTFSFWGDTYVDSYGDFFRFFAGLTAILAKCGIKKTDSDIATGASWLCYYYAIQNGIVSVVVPIDKLSILVSIALSYIVFHEKLTKKAFLGLALMVLGTLGMTIFA